MSERARDATRAALLASGEALLRRGALREALARVLRPGDVARGAGLSRQTWYRHFPGGAHGFADELAAWCLRAVEDAEAPVFAAATGLTRGDPETVTERIRALGEAGFSLHVRPESMLPLLLAAALTVELRSREEGDAPAPNPERAPAALRAYYERESGLGALALGELLRAWGRVPVPQLSLEALVATFGALGEGIAIRHQADPDRYDARLFTDALVLLLPALTVPDAASRPAARAGVDDEAGSGRARAANARRLRSEADVIAAARAEFAALGYQQTTIAAVSAASGVSETTIFDHFGSKAGLAAACFAPAIGGLEAALRAEAAEPVLTRLHHHLQRLCVLLHRSLAFVSAWFDVGALDQAPGRAVERRDPRLVAPVQRPLVPLLTEAQAEGLVTGDLPASQLAGGITILALTRVFGYPYETPEVTTAAVERLALHGILEPVTREATPA